MIKRDFCSKPFKVVVVVGESAAGSEVVAQDSFKWADIVVEQINQFQEEPATMFMRPVEPATISQMSRHHGPGRRVPAPRTDEDVAALNPDLLIIACGLNDMRSGSSPELFRNGVQKLIDRVREKINPVIVLVNVFHIWKYHSPKPWIYGGPEQSQVYNLVLEQLAEKNHVILADVYSAQNLADWTVDAEGIALNDLGHRLVGNAVFAAIASNCSCLSIKALAESKKKPAEQQQDE